MQADISNCEVKIFKKRDGRISFHLRSHVIFYTPASFNAGSYLNDLNGFIQFPGEEWLEFTQVWLAEDAIAPFDGKHQVHEFGASLISSTHNLKPCLAKIKFTFIFKIHSTVLIFEPERVAIVKKGRRGL